MSSLTFAGILTEHLLEAHHGFDLLWFLLSLTHGITALTSLCYGIINRVTFVLEAIFGFMLWNYISLSVIMTQASFASQYSPEEAGFAPVFVLGLATWWILTRYPTVQKGK
jgi:hypothetical protein